MKVLIVLTNVEKYEKIERPTGLWLSEPTHFYDVLVKNGIDADFVSPKGGYVPLEPRSVLNTDEINWAYYGDEDFRNRASGNTLRSDDMDANDYAAAYYAGGHGTMWDFLEAIDLGKVAPQIYRDEGLVSAVYHGVVGLSLVTGESGKSILAGHTVTGFNNEEEEANGITNEVPFLAEDALKEKGASYQSGTVFSEVVQIDGRLLTGQSPQSTHQSGEAVVEALKN